MILSSSLAVQRGKRSALLALVGCVWLCAGILVYLADRPASHAVWIPSIAAFGGRNLFGALGQWLPSLVHPLAFSLLTAAVLKPSARAGWSACAFWGAVNSAFEFGQHPALASTWNAFLHAGAGDWAISRHLLNYFLRGTFDLYDLCAATLGAISAGTFLQCFEYFQERCHG